MTIKSFLRYFTPVNVFIAGMLGGVIAYMLFVWSYPKDVEFVKANSFLILVFLFMITSCLITIFFLPSWGIFLWLKNERVKNQNTSEQWNENIRLLFVVILISIILILFFKETGAVNKGYDEYFPKGHRERVYFMVIYSFLVVLPAGLGMIVIFSSVQEILVKIQTGRQSEDQLFAQIRELQLYRGMLQNLLIMSGIILSMIPIITAGSRTVLIEAYPSVEKIYPTSYVIIYGLIFTSMLLLVYVPTYLILSEAGKQLRESLCPLSSLANLANVVETRKSLEELLQINIGMTQNLKSGFFTLTPLVSSLVVSLLGINIS